MTIEDLAKANAIYDKIVDLKREVEALRNPTSEIRIVGRAFGCSATSKSVIDEKLKEVEKLKDMISSLNSDLNNAIKRKTKNELVLKELRSLNRTMKVGQISCMDCGSNHISYDSAEAEFSFDISTSVMRTQIINSIEEKIEIYTEEISRLSSEIAVQQKKMNDILDTEDVSIEELLIAKIDLDGTQDDDEIVAVMLKHKEQMLQEYTKLFEEI